VGRDRLDRIVGDQVGIVDDAQRKVIGGAEVAHDMVVKAPFKVS
jgi:hypothetical protein